MKRNVKLMLFLCMAILQLAIPLYMIHDHQITLKEGQQFKFKAAPVDPYDAFMGRYLSINLEERKVQVEDSSKYRPGRNVYVMLEKDEQGYAKISGLSIAKPENPSYYKTTVDYTDDNHNVYLAIPFSRYYMPEAQAQQAEKEINTLLRDRTNEVYITVRINKGNAVMERVYISGQTIEDYLKNK